MRAGGTARALRSRASWRPALASPARRVAIGSTGLEVLVAPGDRICPSGNRLQAVSEQLYGHFGLLLLVDEHANLVSHEALGLLMLSETQRVYWNNNWCFRAP